MHKSKLTLGMKHDEVIKNGNFVDNAPIKREIVDKIIKMKIIRFYKISFIVLILISQSCSNDTTKNLGSGYFYRDEGGDIKDILCKETNTGEIPATVLDYDFDDNYIVAKQKPRLPQEPLYDKVYKYNKGNKEYYYWLIVKSSNLILGPLSIEELKNLKIKYKVPNNIVLK